MKAHGSSWADPAPLPDQGPVSLICTLRNSVTPGSSALYRKNQPPYTIIPQEYEYDHCGHRPDQVRGPQTIDQASSRNQHETSGDHRQDKTGIKPAADTGTFRGPAKACCGFFLQITGEQGPVKDLQLSAD
jgi:hypothetical protein